MNTYVQYSCTTGTGTGTDRDWDRDRDRDRGSFYAPGADIGKSQNHGQKPNLRSDAKAGKALSAVRYRDGTERS